jgi:adenine-specific DNA-methyltransferase
LINYLSTNSHISEDAIRDFILYGDFYKDIDTEKTLRTTDENGKTHYEIDPAKPMKISEEIFSLSKGINNLKLLDDLLANIRVADPAVGSGAFPLGMLNEVVRARQNLSAYMAIGMNAYDTRLMYTLERSPYMLKYTTIKNCIFAADIEPSAVDIARLRLWLSLVIDDEINPNAQNSFEGHQNPSPLPNLECNIVCGNSLVDEFEGTPLINAQFVDWYDGTV